MNAVRCLSLTITFALLAACGGGGGSSTPPPTSNNPPASPAPTPDPGPTTDPNPEPDPNQQPDPSAGPDPIPDPGLDPDQLISSGQIQSVRSVLSILLLVEAAGKSGVVNVPAEIALDINAHGPFPECEDPCNPLDSARGFPVSTEEGEVLVTNWINIDNKLDFDPAVDVVYFEANQQGVDSGISIRRIDDDVVLEFYPRFEYEHNLYGGRLGGIQTLEISGPLTLQYDEDRLRISHDSEADTASGELAFYHLPTGELLSSLTTEGVFEIETNIADRDAIDASFTWVRSTNHLRQVFETLSPLDFGGTEETPILEAGSFLYSSGSQFRMEVIRVSVDADPAYLLFEIDKDDDGVFELSGRVAQSTLQLIKP